jgi:hypothetical protein
MPVWHVFANSRELETQDLSVFQYRQFDLVRITDPITGQVILEKEFTDAHPGDVWELRWLASPAGDFDADGDVDGDDFLAWQAGFGMTAGATRADGDADTDGDVDGDDFLIWQSQFGTVDRRDAAAVPEPASYLLPLIHALALGALMRPRW